MCVSHGTSCRSFYVTEQNRSLSCCTASSKLNRNKWEIMQAEEQGKKQCYLNAKNCPTACPVIIRRMTTKRSSLPWADSKFRWTFSFFKNCRGDFSNFCFISFGVCTGPMHLIEFLLNEIILIRCEFIRFDVAGLVLYVLIQWILILLLPHGDSTLVTTT